MGLFDVLKSTVGGVAGAGKRLIGGLTNQPGAEEQREGLQTQAGAAGNFAGQGEGGYLDLGGQLGQEAEYLRDIARGRESVSALQLRQALDQNLAAQRSAVAGASPQNAAMAALNASQNAARQASGLAGQQAIAGIQERQAAQNALANMLLGQRGQDVQVALGSRQNAVGALTGITPGQSPLQQFGGLIQGGLQAYLGGRGAGGQGQGH